MKARICVFMSMIVLLASNGYGEEPAGNPGMISPLSSLALPHAGRAMHEGSWDRSGGNADMRAVKPGETITLLDYKGAGIIHRFWVTIAPRGDQKIHREAILRMYWDDSETPCVESPIGDFFGVGFGLQKDYVSLPMNEISGGYNCYWPMPFHKHARWTLTNMSDRKIDAFYYNIDFTAFDSLPADMKHFHASWRRENPTNPKKNYTILEAKGDGHFVGTALFMQAIKPRGIGFLEGDETIYIDQDNVLKMPVIDPTEAADQKGHKGAPTPNIIGTGTEDYFSSGWYFDHGTYSAPYHGCVIKDEAASRISAYRWHIEDAMPFHKNIRVSIEHGTNNSHVADYSSVAYFYQSEPHMAYPSLPEKGELLMPNPPPVVKHFSGAIEGEKLAPTASVTGGTVGTQGMSSFGGQWSGESQLWWRGGKPGDEMTVNLKAPADGMYELSAWVTTAPDYGTVALVEGGKTLDNIDLHSANVASHPAKRLGTVSLKQGENPIHFRITGKNEKSTNYLVGLDAFELKPVK